MIQVLLENGMPTAEQIVRTITGVRQTLEEVNEAQKILFVAFRKSFSLDKSTPDSQAKSIETFICNRVNMEHQLTALISIMEDICASAQRMDVSVVELRNSSAEKGGVQ